MPMRPPADRFLLFIVAVLLLWPPVHALLMPALGVSTWRFGGWGMYATPVPRRSHVIVVGRDCGFSPPLLHRNDGARGLVLGAGSFRTGALPLDPTGHDLARDVASLRRETDVLALARRVRGLHRVDSDEPLAVAIVQPRIRGDVAFAHAAVFVVSADFAVEHGLRVSTLAGIDALLPSCGGAQ